MFGKSIRHVASVSSCIMHLDQWVAGERRWIILGEDVVLSGEHELRVHIRFFDYTSMTPEGEPIVMVGFDRRGLLAMKVIGDVLIGVQSREIVSWDLRTRKFLKKVSVPCEVYKSAICFGVLEGTHIVGLTSNSNLDDGIYLFDLQKMELLRMLPRREVFALGFMDNHIAIALLRSVAVIDCHTAHMLHNMPSSFSLPIRICVLGRVLIVGSNVNIVVWRPDSPENPEIRLKRLQERFTALALNRGMLVVAQSEKVELWAPVISL